MGTLFVLLQRIAQAPLDISVIAFDAHVDEITDDQSAKITQPQLPGDLLGGLQVDLVGTFLGACIIGVLDNGLLLIGMGDFARQIVTGLIIVIAVGHTLIKAIKPRLKIRRSY